MPIFLFRGVGADDGEAQPRHRLAQKSAAAADIQQRQAFERPERLGVAAETGRRLLADEGQPDRIEFVQRREFAGRIPPFRRQARRIWPLRRDRWKAERRGHAGRFQG